MTPKKVFQRGLLLLSVSACVGASFAAASKSIWDVEIVIDKDGKYAIEGPFAIGDPVHETLTIEAMIRAGLTTRGAVPQDNRTKQVLRGVFWNDDPCAQLFKEPSLDPLAPSFGVAWFLGFNDAKKIAKNSKIPYDFGVLDCPLLGYSHFGRLQYLHGMASQDGEAAPVTSEAAKAWILYMYRIASGEIPAKSNLSSDPTGNIIANLVGNKTVMELLRADTVDDTRYRALGSALHTIQDSFAQGHVSRKGDEIVMFLSYANQDSKKHAHDDAWSKGQGTALEKTLAIPGTRDALDASTKLLALYRSAAKSVEVSKYLDAGPFKLSSIAQPSGPGEYK